MVYNETFFAGVGKYVFNDNVLNVFDHNGRLLLEVVVTEEEWWLPII